MMVEATAERLSPGKNKRYKKKPQHIMLHYVCHFILLILQSSSLRTHFYTSVVRLLNRAIS